ncbi:indole-3-glycerol phosphate synthase TrpC [Lentibacillus sediminis]|uniref:indole-3-glycerol phosphate synthase TrpC n=1 Tax=Lentibacillus sediminis TaxID=1940529 RepID=UPI000C1C01F6|nr:indole-3-glycerol phosphate synthase TrpC [Lentibacillus sediminis]
MTILDTILAEKQKEVAELQGQRFTAVPGKTVPSFKETVLKANKMPIIAEIKRASPSKGAIDMAVDPATQAKIYESAGASAISVLTDKAFFQGSMEDLQAVREAVDLPILCKDFIIDPMQLQRTKAAGAQVALLIAAALSDEQLRDLYEEAVSLELEVICEVHNEEELERVLELNPEIIGINNRDLKTFQVDLMTTNKLATIALETNQDTIIVSESGIKQRSDVVRVQEAGANAVLIGETLMRSPDLPATFNELQVAFPVKGAE